MERKKYDSHIRQCLDDPTRIMSHLDSTFKPGFSLAYSVLSALETLWQLRYINSIYHTIPYHNTPPASSAQERDVQDCGVGVEVS